MIRYLPALSAIFLLSTGCASTGAASAAAAQASAKPTETVAVSERTRIVPLLDAHQHMMSPVAMALNVRPASPPAVAVPKTLVALLKARGKGVDDSSYGALFAPDAMILAEEHGRWWTGKAQILDSLGNFGTGRQFVPTSYALDGSAGYVAGVLRSAAGQDTHTFVLGLQKGADRWRIRSEMKQPIAPPTYAPAVDAARIIAVLDDAGIKYATVLSVAYWFGDPDKQVDDRHSKSRAENDWVIAETRKYADRLIPFCGVNPLDDYAIQELQRCAALGVRGMKVHRNSKFDPSKPEHLQKLQQFFRAANTHRMAIVIHLRGSAQLYLDHILPHAPDVPIQIAHMGSGGLPVLNTFGDAIAAGKAGTKNLWFDWTQFIPIEGLWTHGLPDPSLGGRLSPDKKAAVADAMRKVGLHRILFGTDMPLPWNPTPRDWWRKTILTLPLTDSEVQDLADNLPPYVSGR